MIKKIIEDVLLESKLARVWQWFNSDNPLVIISAYKEDVTQDTNIEQNKKLEAKIKAKKYGYIKVDGAWYKNFDSTKKIQPEEEQVGEESFVVIGDSKTDEEQMKKDFVLFCKEFDQNSIFWKSKEMKNKAVWLDRTGTITQRFSELHLDRLAQYFSKLKFGPHKGRPFYIDME